MSTRVVEPIEHEIYRGRIRVGTVRSTKNGYDAFSDDGQGLGKFNSESAAVAEILRHTKVEEPR